MSYELPAIHLASLYRAYAQGPGGLRSGTLLEDEQAPDLLALLPKPANGAASKPGGGNIGVAGFSPQSQQKG